MQPEFIYLVLATIILVLGVITVRWIHSQYGLDISIPPSSPNPEEVQPLISVIVPARNEARNIRRSIEALAAQSYQNLELIVVDDGSTDSDCGVSGKWDSRRWFEPSTCFHQAKCPSVPQFTPIHVSWISRGQFGHDVTNEIQCLGHKRILF